MSAIHVRLAPPPRRVPLSLKIANVFNPAVQICFVFFGFGMVFFWAFVAQADFSFFTETGERLRATGSVQSVEATGASENKSRVMAHHYEFSVAGRTYRGTSYSSDRSAASGETVAIEYLKADPSKSRIEGMRRKIFGPAVSFVAIFPLIGLLGVVFAMRYGLRTNAVLRDGNMVAVPEGAPVPVDPRLTRLAGLLNVPPAQMEKIKQSGVMRRRLTESQIQIVDPQRPGSTAGLSPQQIDENGDLRGSFLNAIRLLLIPALVLGFNTLPILSRLGIDWIGAMRSLFEKLAQ
jgi:hypothetical protein